MNKTNFYKLLIVNRFWVVISRLFVFLFITFLIIFGSASIFRAPIIADDLRVLTEGLADLSEASNFTDLILIAIQNVKASTGFHHIMPIAGLVAFLENSFVYLFINVITDPLLLFSILRSFWHVFAVAAMSLFISGFVSKNNASKFRNFIIFYIIAGIGFISLTQIHSAWKEAPIASYGLHGSGIAGIGFLYLHAIHQNARNPVTKSSRTLGVVIIGIIGTLTYEMFVAPLIAGIVFFYYLKHQSKDENQFKFNSSGFYSVIVPAMVFFLANFVRLLFPEKNYYDGTQVGDLSQIIPNFVSGVYGSLPLTYLGTAVGQVGFQPVSLETNLFYLISVALLILIFFFELGKNRFEGIEITLRNRNAIRLVLILLWLTSTLSFMFSAKYQRELGVSIGTVYIFYAVGNLAIIGIISIWAVGKNKIATVSLLSSLIAIGLFTNTYNYALVDKIETNTTIISYTKMYSSFYDESLINPKRCELLSNLRASNLPEYYKNSLIQNFQTFYFNEFGKPFCQTY